MKNPFKRFSTLEIPEATGNPVKDYEAMEAVIKTDRFSRLTDENSKPYLEALAKRFVKLDDATREEKMSHLPELQLENSVSGTKAGIFITAVASQPQSQSNHSLMLDASCLTKEKLDKRYEEDPTLRSMKSFREVRTSYDRGMGELKEDLTQKQQELYADTSLDNNQRTVQMEAYRSEKSSVLINTTFSDLSTKLSSNKQQNEDVEQRLTQFREHVYESFSKPDITKNNPAFLTKELVNTEEKLSLGEPNKTKADYVVIQQKAALERYFDGINNGVVSATEGGKGTVEQNFGMKMTGDMDTLALTNFNEKKTAEEKTQANKSIIKSSTEFLAQEPHITPAILKLAEEKITDPAKQDEFKRAFTDNMKALRGTVGTYQETAIERNNDLQKTPSISQNPAVTNTPEKTDQKEGPQNEVEQTPPPVPPRDDIIAPNTSAQNKGQSSVVTDSSKNQKQSAAEDLPPPLPPRDDETPPLAMKPPAPPVSSRQGRRSLTTPLENQEQPLVQDTPPPPLPRDYDTQTPITQPPLTVPPVSQSPQKTTGTGTKDVVTGTQKQAQDTAKSPQAELAVKKSFFTRSISYSIEKEEDGEKVKATLTAPRNVPYDISAKDGAFHLAAKDAEKGELVVTPTKDKLTFDASNFKGTGKDSPQYILDSKTGKKASFMFDKEGNIDPKTFKAEQGFSHNIDIKTNEGKTLSLNHSKGTLEEAHDKHPTNKGPELKGMDKEAMAKAVQGLHKNGTSKVSDVTSGTPTHSTATPSHQGQQRQQIER